jgi:hypothetical protein
MPVTHIEEKLTRKQRIDKCIELAEQLNNELETMLLEWPDNRGQVQEAKECAEYIIDDMNGHKKDVAAGKEDFSLN